MPTRFLSGLALSAAVLLGTGCATLSNRAVCPAEGGDTWHEVRSAHFRVRTNLDPEDARKVTEDLEKFRRALLLIWTRKVDPPGQLEAIVLRSRGQLAEFQGPNTAGFFKYTEDGPLIVMDGGGSLFAGKAAHGAVQAHELAHYLSRFFLLRQPRWFAEGLASFLETVHLNEEGTKAVFGKPDGEALRYVQAGSQGRVKPRLTLEELWRWGQSSNTPDDLSPHYASSWLWFHYLLNHHAPRFQDFQMRLAHAEEPREAFELAFEGAGDLEAGVQDYLAGGEFGLWEFPLEAVATELQVRELEGAEVHAIRARLHLLGERMAWEERKKAAQLEVTQALRENPTNVSAVRLQAGFMENHAERLTLAEALVKAHPDSGQAWRLLAGAHAAAGSPMAVREQALVRAVELSPDDASAHNDLAWLYVQSNAPEKGHALALRAVKRAPYSPWFVDTYAAVLFGVGRQCAKSVSTQRRAIELLDEQAPVEVRQDFQSRLTKYETACREREAAGAAAPAQSKPAQ